MMVQEHISLRQLLLREEDGAFVVFDADQTDVVLEVLVQT
jgi:hypothetical protein